MVTRYIEQNGHVHLPIQELTDKMKEHVDDAMAVFVNKHICCVNYYYDVYAPLRIRRVTSTSSLYYCCCCRYNLIESLE